MKWSNSSQSLLICSKPKWSTSWPFWHASNRQRYRVQTENPKTGILSLNSLQPSVCTSSFPPPGESSRWIRKANPHTSWPICAADDRTGTLLHDPSYTVKCFSKELFINEVISSCTFTRGGRKVGRKEGRVFVCSPTPTPPALLPSCVAINNNSTFFVLTHEECICWLLWGSGTDSLWIPVRENQEQ